MSKFFPTAEEALETFEAERALPAFDGARAADPWNFAVEQIEHLFDGLRGFTEKPTWCLRAAERASRSLRERHIIGDLVVPVRPRPGTKDHKTKRLLKHIRRDSRKWPGAISSWSATEVLWREVTESEQPRFGYDTSRWEKDRAQLALAIARLKLAHEDAKLWDMIDSASAWNASLMTGGAIYRGVP